jgi:SAM-dependent methyltransferase
MVGFVSPRTGAALLRDGETLVSVAGERVPVVRSIPRFVSSDGYTAAFGLQWNAHAETQLDSHTNATLSRERLERCLGISLEQLAGLRVLEAGCGAGRFTELLIEAGALVHAVDLSSAVDANRRNIGDPPPPNYVVAQADLRDLPFPAKTFDLVLCLGVLQHTPSPEASIADLWRMVAPGGLLAIDHYSWTLSRLTKLSPLYRLILKQMRPESAKRITDALVDVFFPLHWAVRRVPPLQWLLSRVSPCLSYSHKYPQLTRAQHKDWCRLDTYDDLTDWYKRLRTAAEIRGTLERLGAMQIESVRRGAVIEARCRKPREANAVCAA